MDLNTIVTDYKVSRSGSANELLQLQRKLSDVPIDIAALCTALAEKGGVLNDLVIRAELVEPSMRLFLLDDLITQEAADEITKRMRLPYARIFINGDPFSRRFYRNFRSRLGEFVVADTADPTARVLSNDSAAGIAVVFERPGGEEYLEMYVTDTPL